MQILNNKVAPKSLYLELDLARTSVIQVGSLSVTSLKFMNEKNTLHNLQGPFCVWKLTAGNMFGDCDDDFQTLNVLSVEILYGMDG